MDCWQTYLLWPKRRSFTTEKSTELQLDRDRPKTAQAFHETRCVRSVNPEFNPGDLEGIEDILVVQLGEVS